MKRFICILLCLAMVFPLIPVQAIYEDSVILIETREQFLSIADNPRGHYRLENSISLGSYVPIEFFSGTLDGNGHTITYSMSAHPDRIDYGLFLSLRNAQLMNLTVNASFNSTLEPESDNLEYHIGGIAATAYNSTFGGVNVNLDFSLSCSNENTQMSVGALVGYGSYNSASVCIVDSNVDLSGCNLFYYGFMPAGNEVYYSSLEGSVNLSGVGVWVALMYGATECVCDQAVYMEGNNCDFYGDQYGFDNILYGDYVFRNVGTFARSTLTGLYESEGSTFGGSITAYAAGSPQLQIFGAVKSSWAEVVAELTGTNQDGGVKIYGLSDCSDSTFEGNILAESGVTYSHYYGALSHDLCAAYSGEYNTCMGDITYIGYGDTEAYGLRGENNSYYEGNITGEKYTYSTQRELSERYMGGLYNCDDSIYVGTITPACGYRVNLYGIRGGSGNYVEAELNGAHKDICIQNRTYAVYEGEKDNYFTGSISGEMVYVLEWSPNSYADAQVEGDFTELFSNSRHSYFTGNVSCGQFSFGSSDCYASANVIIKDGYAFHSPTVSAIHTENYYFEGTIDMYVHEDAKAYVQFGFPVQVHHPKIGTVNTGSMTKRYIYVHNNETWGYLNCTHPQVIYTDSLGEQVPFLNDQEHYTLVLENVKHNNAGTPESVVGSWNGNMTPEQGVRPQRENASYTLQMISNSGGVIQSGIFSVNGTKYQCDENGCVEIEDGPGVIHPLIAYVSDGNGGFVEQRRYNVYYPIPNRVNRIPLGSKIDIDVDLTLLESENSESGSGTISGGVVEVGDKSIPTIQFPFNLSLEGPLANGADLAVDWDGETNRLRVTIGKTNEHSVRPGDFDFARFDELVEQLDSPSLDVRSAATKLLQKQQAKHAGIFYGDWPVKSAGFMEFGLNSADDLQLLSGGYILQASSEHRATWPLPLFPGAYGTLALLGDLVGQLSLEMGDWAKGEPALVNMTGSIQPSIRAEGAIGGGLRAARLYAELGIGAQMQGEVSLLLKDIYSSLNLDAIIDIFGGIGILAFEKKITIAQMKSNLWPGLSQKAMARALLEEGGEFAIAPRTYAQGLQNSRGPVSYVGLSETNNYPYSDVRLLSLDDGRYLLVYTDDDLNRGSADRSTLRACIGTVADGELVWGESVTVEADGTGDYGFVVETSGTNAAIVWQDAENTFGEGQNLQPADLAADITLSQTILDCSGDVPVAGTVHTIAPAGNYPYFMEIFYDYGECRAAWVTTDNADPSVVLDDERETVWFSDSLGKEGIAVATDQIPIEGIALLYYNLYWNNTDEEGTGTIHSYDLYYNELGSTYTGQYANLQANGDHFICTENDTLFSGYESFVRVVADQGDVYTGSVTLGSDDQIYTAQHSMEQSRICEVKEGKARPIRELDGYVSSWDACDGYVVAVVRSGFTESDTASFQAGTAEKIQDVRLDVQSISGIQAGPGTNVYITLQITNLGYENISSVPVTILGADGSTLLQKTYDVKIDTDESQCIDISLPIGDHFNTQTVTLHALNQTQALTLGGKNLSVDAKWNCLKPKGVDITVTNDASETSTATLVVSDEDQVIYQQPVTVEKGQAKQIWAEFDSCYQETTTIKVELLEGTDYLNSSDNAASVTVQPVQVKMLQIGSIFLPIDGSQALEITPWPEGTELPEVTYSSANESVATVDTDGYVSAVGAGETEITVTLPSGEAFHTVVVVSTDGDTEIAPDGTEPTEPTDSTEPSTDPTDPDPQPTDPSTTPTDPSTKPTDPGTEPTDPGTQPTQPSTQPSDPPEDTCAHRSTKLVNQIEADCTEAGYTGDTVCTLCNTVIKRGTAISASGHKWGDWKVTKPATGAAEGEESRSCKLCDTVETRSIDKLVNPFVDVIAGKFYEAPVLWAVEKEITKGIDDTHFAPDSTCNRGQVVTFLWRAAGSPEPTTTVNPFSDVKNGAYYYKAVLWAVEKGITKGMTATTFGTDAPCTRGQVATFLWRTLNQPNASSSTNPFTDVVKGKYYYDAVLWAVEAEVTKGMTKTTFAPDNSCTRGQIVTFLHRALG